MTAFATVADYQKFYPGTITIEQVSPLTAALDAACEDIRDYTHQTLSPVANETIVVDGTGTQWLLLPQAPVTAVASITIDKNLDTELVVTDATWRSDGTVYRKCMWPCGASNITFVYSHGYATMPSNLVRVACELARVALYPSTPGFRSETIGGYSYTKDPGAITAADFGRVLDRHVRRAVNV